MGSFKYGSKSDIDLCPLVGELKSQDFYVGKAGCETWMCAFAPDCSYFAWSLGSRIVELIPWNRSKSLPAILDSTDEHGDQIQHDPLRIDCGDLVWSLAFGSATSEKKKNSINVCYNRFNFAKDLILATGLNSGRIRIWDVNTGKLMIELLDHKDVIRDLKFAPDGSLQLISASRDMTLKIWDLHDDGNMKKTLRGHSKWVFSCAWSPDAKRLASVGSGKSVVIWDMETYEIDRKLEGHHNDVVSCEFSPDGALLITASWDTRVIIWDPYFGTILGEFGHLFPAPTPIFASGANDTWIRGCAFSNDGVHIATVADDGYVRFWSLFNQDVPKQISPVQNALCCSYSPDGNVLAVGTRSGSVLFWLAPMCVQSLQHLCRLAVRRIVSSANVDNLDIPLRLKDYLFYKDWR